MEGIRFRFFGEFLPDRGRNLVDYQHFYILIVNPESHPVLNGRPNADFTIESGARSRCCCHGHYFPNETLAIVVLTRRLSSLCDEVGTLGFCQGESFFGRVNSIERWFKVSTLLDETRWKFMRNQGVVVGRDRNRNRGLPFSPHMTLLILPPYSDRRGPRPSHL